MKYWSISLIFMFNLQVVADDVVVYRWVDKNNIVHFSQNQPPTGDYTEIIMANSSRPNKKTSTTTHALLPIQKEKSINQISDNDTTNASEQCKEARKNLTTLTEFERIRFIDSNGETQILNKEAQKEQIAINEQLIATYCIPSTNQ